MTWARVTLDIALIAWWIVTIHAIYRRPARRWAWGQIGRIAAIAMSLVLVEVHYGVFMPWGAFIIWWLRLRGPSAATELPMADGRPQP